MALPWNGITETALELYHQESALLPESQHSKCLCILPNLDFYPDPVVQRPNMEFLDNAVLEYAQTFIPEMWPPWTVEAISTVCHSGILEYFKMLKYDRVSYSGYHLYTP